MRKIRYAGIGCLILAVLLFITGPFDRAKVWADLTDPDDVEEVHFDRGSAVTAENGYGIISRGPYFNLQPGKYMLRWRADGDGENSLRLKCQKGRIEPCEFPLPVQEQSGEISFEIKEPVSGFEIEIEFTQGTHLEIYDLRLYSPRYRDLTFLACLIFIVLGIWLLTITQNRESAAAFPILLLTVLFGAAPALKSSVTMTSGADAAAKCFLEAAQAIPYGMPLRMPGITGGLLYLPGALLLRLGASLAFVMNLQYAGLTVAALAGGYSLAKECTGSQETGLAAGILYVLAPYRVFSLFVYGHLEEAAFLAFLPFFAWGLLKLLRGQGVPFVLSVFFLSLTWTPLFLMTCIAGAGILAIRLPRLISEKRLGKTALAVFVSVLICLCWIPDMNWTEGSLSTGPLSPAALLLWGQGDRSWLWFEKTLTGWPLEIGVPILIGLILAVYRRVMGDHPSRALCWLASAGGVLVFLSTTLFPRNLFPSGVLAESVSLGWHFLGPASVCLVPMAAWGVGRIQKKDVSLLGVFLLSALMIAPTMTEQTRNQKIMKYGQIPATAAAECGWSLYGNGTLTITKNEVVHIEADVKMEGPGDLRLPYREGDRLWLDGKMLEGQRDGQEAVVVFTDSVQGHLVLQAAETLKTRCLEVLSLLGFILMILLWRRKKI